MLDGTDLEFPTQLTHSAAQEILLKIRAREDCRPEIARALVLAGHQLLRLDRGTSRLESIFIELTQRERLS